MTTTLVFYELRSKTRNIDDGEDLKLTKQKKGFATETAVYRFAVSRRLYSLPLSKPEGLSCVTR